jgi:hypothetical protein
MPPREREREVLRVRDSKKFQCKSDTKREHMRKFRAKARDSKKFQIV